MELGDLETGFLSGGMFFLPKKKTVKTPSGVVINSRGDPISDGMTERLGAPPDFLRNFFDNSGQAPEEFTDAETGENVSAADTGGINSSLFGDIMGAIEGLVGRLAIIILGLVFVAVGLSMFKVNATTVVQAMKKAI